MKVKDLQPGMKVRAGRGHWLVEANFGWRRVMHSVGNYPLEAWVIIYTMSKDNIFRMWSYRNPNDEVEVFEERIVGDLRDTTDEWMADVP